MFCLPNSPDKHEGQDQIIPSSRRASGPRGWMFLKASVAKWILTTSQTQSSLNLLFSSINVIHFVFRPVIVTVKNADPKQHQASLALSAVCFTTVPTRNKREICPEELKRIRQLPMETTELCVAAQRHTDAAFSLTLTVCFCLSCTKGRQKAGRRRGF